MKSGTSDQWQGYYVRLWTIECGHLRKGDNDFKVSRERWSSYISVHESLMSHGNAVLIADQRPPSLPSLLCFNGKTGISDFANEHGCQELNKKARQYIYEHFTEVCKHEEFMQLNACQLIQVGLDARLLGFVFAMF